MKNIILLISDTYRYDNLFSRAERPVNTPELDRFALERATSIKKFHTGSFPTIPHRTDLATGVLGWPHYGWQPIDQSSPNHIAALLNQAGYWTQLICDCPHLFNSRFQHGFQAAVQTRGQEGDCFFLHLNDPVRQIMPRDKTRPSHSRLGETVADVHRWTNRYYQCEFETFPARTGMLAMRWLEENYQASPFFVWVDFFDPHEPWDPPEYMVRRYDPDYDGTPMIHPNYGRADAYTPAELHNLWAHYATEAELVDRWLGRVLQKIEELGLCENSVVLMTSDHGFSIGDHERAGKSNISDGKDDCYWPLYPEVGHVPFMLAGSGIPPGQTLDLIAQPIDIMPTLCELAGVNIEPKQPFDGKSFAAAVGAGAGRHRDFAVSASCLPFTDTVPERAVTPFVTTERWGYAPVGAHGEGELYDLVEDPFAKENLAAAHPDKVRELHGLLVEQLQAHKADETLVKAWRDLLKL